MLWTALHGSLRRGDVRRILISEAEGQSKRGPLLWEGGTVSFPWQNDKARGSRVPAQPSWARRAMSKVEIPGQTVCPSPESVRPKRHLNWLVCQQASRNCLSGALSGYQASLSQLRLGFVARFPIDPVASGSMELASQKPRSKSGATERGTITGSSSPATRSLCFSSKRRAIAPGHAVTTRRTDIVSAAKQGVTIDYALPQPVRWAAGSVLAR
jgi:hypothetical protein